MVRDALSGKRVAWSDLEPANGRYDEGIKNALVADGGTGFTYPTCSAPTFVAGQAYEGGSQVFSFGVFQEFYATQYLKGVSESAISWIGSLQIGLMLGCSIFGGKL